MLLAHPGTQYSFRLATELERQKLLSLFFTGFGFCAGGLFDRFWKTLPARAGRLLANRRVVGVPCEKLRCRPIPELATVVALRRGGNSQALIHGRNASFQHAIPDAALASADAIIGFDTSSWILARRCRQLGIPLIVDQSIAHPDSKTALFEQVRMQFPNWSEGIEPRLPEVRAAEQEEHESAVAIVAASSFTRHTLIERGVPEQKIRVNPYGVNCDQFAPSTQTSRRPFRFIFVGAITARKGVPLVLEAWRQLNAQNAELWLVGHAFPEVASRLAGIEGVRYLGAVPHSEVPALLQQCDTLVFPSYCEGFGLVILEAMASGLPVISTTSTAAADLYRSGEEGWIIGPGDLEQLRAAMTECVAHPATVRAKGVTARQIAQRFSWTAYGERWTKILEQIAESRRVRDR